MDNGEKVYANTNAAWAFVQAYRRAKVKSDASEQHRLHSSIWKPPSRGLWKRDSNARKLGDFGYGLGVMIRDGEGNIVATATDQQQGAFIPEVHEALALLYGLKIAWHSGYRRLIAECDCLSVISKLQNGAWLRSSLGLILLVHSIIRVLA